MHSIPFMGYRNGFSIYWLDRRKTSARVSNPLSCRSASASSSIERVSGDLVASGGRLSTWLICVGARRGFQPVMNSMNHAATAAKIVQFCVEPVDDRSVIPALMLDLLQPLLKLTDLALGYSHEANSRFDLRNSTPKISCVAMPCSTVMPSFAMSAT